MLRGSRDERFPPFANRPSSDDTARDERIESSELLGRVARREHSHRAARRLIGERPDHEEPAIVMKCGPECAMRLEVRWNLGAKVGRSIVKENVFQCVNS